MILFASFEMTPHACGLLYLARTLRDIDASWNRALWAAATLIASLRAMCNLPFLKIATRIERRELRKYSNIRVRPTSRSCSVWERISLYTSPERIPSVIALDSPRVLGFSRPRVRDVTCPRKQVPIEARDEIVSSPGFPRFFPLRERKKEPIASLRVFPRLIGCSERTLFVASRLISVSLV